ncbi:MAG: hypothetical protein OER56_03005 [Hyphomicrobiales bacterium]|nr:hypothetical protein [Hyphomicrobiales bacterium]
MTLINDIIDSIEALKETRDEIMNENTAAPLTKADQTALDEIPAMIRTLEDALTAELQNIEFKTELNEIGEQFVIPGAEIKRDNPGDQGNLW